jgi:hypothetical protein
MFERPEGSVNALQFGGFRVTAFETIRPIVHAPSATAHTAQYWLTCEPYVKGPICPRLTSLYEGGNRIPAAYRIHMNQQAASLDPATPCFVRSLDGGGPKGCYALGVLKETMSLFVGIVHGFETV